MVRTVVRMLLRVRTLVRPGQTASQYRDHRPGQNPGQNPYGNLIKTSAVASRSLAAECRCLLPPRSSSRVGVPCGKAMLAYSPRKSLWKPHRF